MINTTAIHAKIVNAAKPQVLFINQLKPLVIDDDCRRVKEILTLMPHSLVGFYDKHVEFEDLAEDVEAWIKMTLKAPG